MEGSQTNLQLPWWRSEATPGSKTSYYGTAEGHGRTGTTCSGYSGESSSGGDNFMYMHLKEGDMWFSISDSIK